MTASELKELFNLRYNNALEGAPGIDDYEISLYLTSSQEEIVKGYADSENDELLSFDLKEKARRVLNELVKHEVITDATSSDRGLVSESVFYELEAEPLRIVLETATIDSSGTIYDGKVITVVPTTYDQFMRSKDNPFRKPNTNKVLRLDISKENSLTTVELISEESLSAYTVRYIAVPSPIIITDLLTDDEFLGLGLTINGNTSVATCALNSSVHSEIVDRAVELATLDYRQGDLQSRVALNKRV